MSDSWSSCQGLVSGIRLELRSEVLILAALGMMDATGLAAHKFAERVAENYVRLVPEEKRKTALRVAAPNDSEGYLKLLDSNYRMVKRWMAGEVIFPADVEEAWLESLDQPFRNACVFELCVRFGVLPVLINVDADVTRLAEFMRDEADAIMALAPIFADGGIDDQDRPYAKKAIQTLRRVASDCAGMIGQLETILGQDQGALSVVRK